MWYPKSFAVVLGDVDGDGDLDAFVANGHTDGEDTRPNMVWLNDSTGKFTDSGQRLGGWQVTWSDSRAVVALGDVDGDGDLGAFVGNSTTAKIWANDGRFSDSGQDLTYSDRHVVTLGDVDGDGDLDVFAGSFWPGNRFIFWIEWFTTAPTPTGLQSVPCPEC